MIDVILSSRFRQFLGDSVVDPKGLTDVHDFERPNYIDLAPGNFLLGLSVDVIETPHDRLGIVMPRSTYLRCGLEFGSGFLHPGWSGKLVLELSNKNKHRSLRLYVGEPIASVAFVVSPETPLYAGKYADQNPMGPIW